MCSKFYPTHQMKIFGEVLSCRRLWSASASIPPSVERKKSVEMTMCRDFA